MVVLPAFLFARFALYNTPAGVPIVPKEVFAVVRCPKCATEVDVDEDEVEEGEILACPECETEMEVIQIHPVKVNAISDDDDDDEDEEEESEDGDDLDEDDEDEEEEEKEEL
jgi:lysine biosynthesis protein LysW